MPFPTGNRWRDPKTGKIANPRNIDLGVYKGKDAAKLKYGPAVGAPGNDPESPRVRGHRVKGGPSEVTEEPLEEVKPVLGTAFRERLEQEEPEPPAPSVPATEDAEAYEALIQQVREYGRRAQQGDAEATAELNKLAETEYARESPRMPIVKRLAAFGIKRPKKE